MGFLLLLTFKVVEWDSGLRIYESMDLTSRLGWGYRAGLR